MLKVSKEIFYFFLIIGIFITLSPVFIIIGLFILIDSGRPVFYYQKRVGLRGRIFNIYKFRTMIKNADYYKNKLRLQNEADGPVFKIFNDPRYTHVGKFLSHTGLDELPQLLNIFKGEMALFGPRPLPVYEYRKLKTWQKQRQQILPGIISSAILDGKYHQDFQKWMSSDLNYLKNKSFVLDARLLWRTLGLLTRLLRRELGSILSF